MFPNVEGYLNYHIFQSTKLNKSSVNKHINEFVKVGWDIIGNLNLNEVQFTQLGWLSSKGNPIYPTGFEPNDNH
ncbi:hypothetical protein FDC50_10280 [Clostridium botulinum]|nr:hypothetical protein KU41_17305 [Clostridium botulinum]MBY6804324.1 hypothetical protein [Clostridium botulinum]MBY6813287.1 hypothetical protein [Clostridium botulinum]MBY6821979.1 hypothetical protein [Clostridium botulinum]NFJ49900.1 hypothetical protein [Clostridium botulinum]